MSRPFGVLRPEPGNAATAARIEAAGHTALRLPLFRVEPVAWALPDPGRHDALLLTSANAVRHAGPQLRDLRALPVIAVGEATAAAARAAGFTVQVTGAADVAALDLPPATLHLAGEDRRPVAAADTRVVYRSVAVDRDLSALAGGVALVHSARAAERLAALLQDRAGVALAAISPAAAEAAGGGWRMVRVADRPTDAATVAAAIALAD